MLGRAEPTGHRECFVLVVDRSTLILKQGLRVDIAENALHRQGLLLITSPIGGTVAGETISVRTECEWAQSAYYIMPDRCTVPHMFLYTQGEVRVGLLL